MADGTLWFLGVGYPVWCVAQSVAGSSDCAGWAEYCTHDTCVVTEQAPRDGDVDVDDASNRLAITFRLCCQRYSLHMICNNQSNASSAEAVTKPSMPTLQQTNRACHMQQQQHNIDNNLTCVHHWPLATVHLSIAPPRLPSSDVPPRTIYASVTVIISSLSQPFVQSAPAMLVESHL